MRRYLADPRLAGAVRIGLGALFLYAGVLKATGVHALADDIANYRLVPAALIPWFSTTLPFVEILAGVALLAGLYARAAALVVAVLMVAFVVALSQAIVRGLDLACGCFGGTEPAERLTLVRDGPLLAAAILVAWADRGAFALLPRRLRVSLGDG